MAELTREAALDLIRANIAGSGLHIYAVTAGAGVPRHAYSIGLGPKCGFELVLAGAVFFSAAQVQATINQVAAGLLAGQPASTMWTVDGLGSFSLGPVHPSWVDLLLLGATDFYAGQPVKAMQLLPDESHWTGDIPDMSRAWSAAAEPVWQWLGQPWTLHFDKDATATTNMDALQGYMVTEAARWEPEQWELFSGSGPDVAPDDIRVVPLATLLALDSSLDEVTRLAVGRALWRDGHGGRMAALELNPCGAGPCPVVSGAVARGIWAADDRRSGRSQQ